MAFESIRQALKFNALFRSYSGRNSFGGEAIYASPILIKCYPSVESKYITDSTGATVFSKTVLYVSADISAKEQDLIILENADSNWFGKDFGSVGERDEYYLSGSVIKNTWCCVCGKPQYWNGLKWDTAFDGNKVDGEITGGFTGNSETIKTVSKYYDGFGWSGDAEDNEGLSIQEIGL